jgi:hypothetical protein
MKNNEKFFGRKTRETCLKFTVILFVFFIVIVSCDSDINFGEQYKKTVYIVNSSNLLASYKHIYGTNNTMVVSIYCASSEAIDHDLHVQIKIDEHVLDSLNDKGHLENDNYVDKVILPSSHYSFSGETDVVIRAGKQYGVLEIPLDVEGLDADISYVLPLSIVSNSAGYEINPRMRSIVYGIELSNLFSGIYSGTSSESPTAIRSLQVTAKALSPNTVRVPIHNLPADKDNLNTNFMQLTVGDGGLVTITPWQNSTVVDIGGSFYDEVQQLFELHYRFTVGNRIYSITERLTNISAPRIVQ